MSVKKMIITENEYIHMSNLRTLEDVRLLLTRLMVEDSDRDLSAPLYQSVDRYITTLRGRMVVE